MSKEVEEVVDAVDETTEETTQEETKATAKKKEKEVHIEMSEMDRMMVDISSGKEPTVSGASPNLSNTFQQRIISKLSYDKKGSKLIVFPMLFAFPFNPLTGEKSEKQKLGDLETYDIIPSKLFFLIKKACLANPELKAKYEAHANLAKGSWVIDPESVRDELFDSDEYILNTMTYLSRTDIDIASKFKAPLASYTAAAKVAGSIIGSDYGKAVRIDTARNPISGAFEGELGSFHKVAKFVSGLLREEKTSIRTMVEKQSGNCLSSLLQRETIGTLRNLKKVDDEAYKKAVGAISDLYPIGAISTKTNIIGFSFRTEPLTGSPSVFVNGSEEASLMPDFEEIDLSKGLIYCNNYSINDQIYKTVGNPFAKDPIIRDTSADVFFDFCIMSFVETRPADSINEVMEGEARRDFQGSQPNTFCNYKKSPQGFVAQFDDEVKPFYVNLVREVEKWLKDVEHIKTITQEVENQYSQPSDIIIEACEEFMREKYPLKLVEEVFSSEAISYNADVIENIYPEDYLAKQLSGGTVDLDADPDAVEAEVTVSNEDLLNEVNADLAETDRETDDEDIM